MRSAKTAKGRVIDMEALAQKNKNSKAIGNGRMNANGDIVDGHGEVIKSVYEKQKEIEKATTPPERTTATDPLKTNGKGRKAKKAPTEEMEDIDEVVAQGNIVNYNERVSDDGERYVEIEYDDGSIETRPLTADEEVENKNNESK